MNIYIHELKSAGKYTAIWGFSLALICIFFLSLYPGIVSEADEFIKIISGYNEAVRNAVGIQVENITTPLGFYGFVIVYLSMFASIQALNLGMSVLSKEVRDKTTDFLLTKPVSRNKILTFKILSAITSIVITACIYIIVSFLMINAVANIEFSYKALFLLSFSLFLIQMFFMALGILIGSFLSRPKMVLPISISVVFGFFMIGAFLVTSSDDIGRYFTPFKYYDILYIINNISYESKFLILNIVVIIAMLMSSYVIYNKREMKAV